ncbi:MAG: TetR/AcrR family transcriptional regulator [Thermoleophilia bacterium]
MLASDPNRQGKARGRPRSSRADTAILRAALDQMQDGGYTRMTMESVAAMAGVSKATVYRRYRSKEDLATAAVDRLTETLTAPDTGDIRADLTALFAGMHGNLSGRRRMAVIGTLLVEEKQNPELMRLFRERVIAPRRLRITTMLKRGIMDGRLRPGIEPEQVADCLIGSYFAHYLTGRPTSGSWPRGIVDLIWDGIKAPAP